jgi:hypothetical protein
VAFLLAAKLINSQDNVQFTRRAAKTGKPSKDEAMPLDAIAFKGESAKSVTK